MAENSNLELLLVKNKELYDELNKKARMIGKEFIKVYKKIEEANLQSNIYVFSNENHVFLVSNNHQPGNEQYVIDVRKKGGIFTNSVNYTLASIAQDGTVTFNQQIPHTENNTKYKILNEVVDGMKTKTAQVVAKEIDKYTAILDYAKTPNKKIKVNPTRVNAIKTMKTLTDETIERLLDQYKETKEKITTMTSELRKQFISSYKIIEENKIEMIIPITNYNNKKEKFFIMMNYDPDAPAYSIEVFENGGIFKNSKQY
ncbi:MAG: hypothetical protein QW594_03525, partial [Candidatus Woesearchaeota archaeon]